MDRRTFICIVASGALACPHVAGAQQASKVWRVGFIAGGFVRQTVPLQRRYASSFRRLALPRVRTLPTKAAGAKDGTSGFVSSPPICFLTRLMWLLPLEAPRQRPRNKRPRPRRSSSLVPVTSWKRALSPVSHALAVT